MIGLQNEINDNENDDEDLFDLLFMNVSQHSTLNTKLIFPRRRRRISQKTHGCARVGLRTYSIDNGELIMDN